MHFWKQILTAEDFCRRTVRIPLFCMGEGWSWFEGGLMESFKPIVASSVNSQSPVQFTYTVLDSWGKEEKKLSRIASCWPEFSISNSGRKRYTNCKKNRWRWKDEGFKKRTTVWKNSTKSTTEKRSWCASWRLKHGPEYHRPPKSFTWTMISQNYLYIAVLLSKNPLNSNRKTQNACQSLFLSFFRSCHIMTN